MSGSTVGVGLTVIVKLCVVPVQVAPAFVKEGVTVIVAEIGEFVALVATKEAIEPVPELTKLTSGLEFVQV